MSSSSTRPTISAVLIVKDEEDVLDLSLAAVAWVDEIVVYDTGSTDATREIAGLHTPHVIEGYWDDDFGAARNRAIAHATSEWILVIDADEVFEGDTAHLRRQLGARATNLFRVSVEDTGEAGVLDAPTVTGRIFRRTEFAYVGRLHEQLTLIDPRTPSAAETMLHVHIKHSGYSKAAIVKHDKGRRNVDIARRDLEEALVAGATAQALDILRINLARALGMAGEHDEALVIADLVRANGISAPHAMAQLATSAVGCAAGLGLDDAVDEWLTVWEESDYSPVWSRAVRVRALAARGKYQEALDILDQLPTTTVDAASRRFHKYELAGFEVSALLATGRRRAAARAATETVRSGHVSVGPTELARMFADDVQLESYVAAIPDAVWRQHAVWCVREASAESIRFLFTMADVRGGDVTALLCLARLAPELGIEELAVCAMAVRRAGLAEHCPLVAVSTDTDAAPGRRAVAAAMALSIYGDDRAVPGLEAALAAVAPEDEADVLNQLEILAPGLVSTT